MNRFEKFVAGLAIMACFALPAFADDEPIALLTIHPEIGEFSRPVKPPFSETHPHLFKVTDYFDHVKDRHPIQYWGFKLVVTVAQVASGPIGGMITRN